MATRLCCITHAVLTSPCIRLGSIRAIEPAAPIVPALGYRPGLDGLRAFAVVAVILYHGDVSWARGGFLGVDVFFVLSGFLITSLLLTEHGATGRVDLGRFWSRRARRLLPALFGVLLGVALYAATWGHPTELGRIRGDGIASLLYVSNWRFVLDGSSYFSLFQAPSPLAHTWSLAIEEQWYLLWPLVLLGLLRVLKVRLNLVALTCGALAAGSAVLMAALFHSGADPSRAYYGTDTRAQALLIGAALVGPVERCASEARTRPDSALAGSFDRRCRRGDLARRHGGVRRRAERVALPRRVPARRAGRGRARGRGGDRRCRRSCARDSTVGRGRRDLLRPLLVALAG